MTTLTRFALASVLVTAYVEAASACTLGEDRVIFISCAPSSMKMNMAVRRCEAVVPPGFAVTDSAPGDGVSMYATPQIQMMTIATRVGPFAPSRDAFLKWASSRMKEPHSGDPQLYAALANLKVWGSQVSRQYHQLLANTPDKCGWHNCQLSFDKSTNLFPTVKAKCVAPDNYQFP